MKKALLVLFLLFGIITVGYAQKVQEVVYLKNGSVLRGSVVEQVPGVSLKVQTADGNIFSYPMTDVEKITKETMRSGYRNALSGSKDHSNQTGYKGFIDLGYTIGTGDYEEDRLEVSTSHGFQINPYLFTGGGVAMNYYLDSEVIGLPIFAHIRGSFLDGEITPFVDFKIGYSPVKDVKGLYVAPSIGCKIKSFDISLGYVMQKATVSYYSLFGYDESEENVGGFSLKVGIEF